MCCLRVTLGRKLFISNISTWPTCACRLWLFQFWRDRNCFLSLRMTILCTQMMNIFSKLGTWGSSQLHPCLRWLIHGTKGLNEALSKRFPFVEKMCSMIFLEQCVQIYLRKCCKQREKLTPHSCGITQQGYICLKTPTVFWCMASIANNQLDSG